jgi:outer membrane protein TolC
LKTIFTFLLCLCARAGAQTAMPSAPTLPPYLPPESVVKSLILESPAVQSARAKKESSTLKAQGIQSGSAEVSLRTNVQQRKVTLGNDRFLEYSLGLERPVRWWGKAELDADLAEQTRVVASIEYADALHEASRHLLKLWFQYLRAITDQKMAFDDMSLAHNLHRVAKIRLAQGEISKMDEALAGAELQRAQAALSTSQAQNAASAALLTRRFPSLPLPSALTPLALPNLPPSLEAMREHFLSQNHELNLLRADAKRLQLLALRLDKDRHPDPTIGVYAAADRGGAERLIGVSVLIPFSGAARSAYAQSTTHEAHAALLKVTQVEQQLSAEFEGMWQQLTFKHQAAKHLNAAAQEQSYAAEKSRKAYAFGEYSFFDVVNMNRLANEQRRTAELTALEVLELSALIQLDMHQLWDFDE